MKRTSHGVTVKLARSRGDVGMECFLAIMAGVCVAAIWLWVL